MDTTMPEFRPDVLDQLTESQLKELEFQVTEFDRSEFDRIADAYGWDSTTVQAVWNWLARKPRPTEE